MNHPARETPIEPPDDAVEIGDGHKIVFRSFEGEVAGLVEWHRKSDGQWCSGWVSFRGRKWEQAFATKPSSWEVISENPLTLQPSLLCRVCGNHGYITNGRWVNA